MQLQVFEVILASGIDIIYANSRIVLKIGMGFNSLQLWPTTKKNFPNTLRTLAISRQQTARDLLGLRH